MGYHVFWQVWLSVQHLQGHWYLVRVIATSAGPSLHPNLQRAVGTFRGLLAHSEGHKYIRRTVGLFGDIFVRSVGTSTAGSHWDICRAVGTSGKPAEMEKKSSHCVLCIIISRSSQGWYLWLVPSPGEKYKPLYYIDTICLNISTIE